MARLLISATLPVHVVPADDTSVLYTSSLLCVVVTASDIVSTDVVVLTMGDMVTDEVDIGHDVMFNLVMLPKDRAN